MKNFQTSKMSVPELPPDISFPEGTIQFSLNMLNDKTNTFHFNYTDFVENINLNHIKSQVIRQKMINMTHAHIQFSNL